MRTFSKGVFGVFALAAFACIASEASACTQACVRVGQYCRQCEDVGYITNVTCQSNGPCGCFFTQNTCELGAPTALFAPDSEAPAFTPATADAAEWLDADEAPAGVAPAAH